MEIVKSYYLRSESIVTVNMLLYGNGKRSKLSIQEVEEALTDLGLVIKRKRLNNFEMVIEGVRE